MLLFHLIPLLCSYSEYTKTCPNQVLNLYTMECSERETCLGNITFDKNGNVSCGCHFPLNLYGNKCYEDNIEDDIDNCYARCRGSNFADYESCEESANHYSIKYFYQDEQWNEMVRGITQNEFLDSIQYDRSYEIVTEKQLPGSFRSGRLMNFVLARFAFNGTFKGFKEITVDLNMCGEENDISQQWRLFGTNFYSDCNFNVPVFMNSSEDEFYNMYLIIDNNREDVPILIRNHEGNRNKNSANYALYKRFFIKNRKEGKYAKNITISIRVSDNNRNIKNPILIIDYQELNDPPPPNYADISYDKKSNSMREFHFSVVYSNDLSKFWQNVTIITIVFLVLALIFWISKSIIYAKHHKDDGTMIFYFVGLFCNSFGVAFYAILFIVTFIMIFCMFKFSKSDNFYLPPQNEFWVLPVIVWISFGLMLIASIIDVFLQTRANVFIIDWESPFEKKLPVSAWRRLMIANEYGRVVAKRNYSTNFTLVVLLFILEGFNLKYLSSPIPNTELVDVGRHYRVLSFAFSTFLWILLAIFQKIVTSIYWYTLKNPFYNFLDLCTTANCSILMMQTQTQGFYLHGRSSHDHTDVDMAKLNENLYKEETAKVGLRGLIDNTEDQVFHVYLENDFGYALHAAYDDILDSLNRKAIQKAKIQDSKIHNEINAMEDYNKLNRWLIRFFEGSEPLHKFIVQRPKVAEILLDWGPQVGKDTILTIHSDIAYKDSLLAGIEWTIYFMYSLLFSGIEMETESPAIAGFVIFIIDLLFLAFYKKRSRHNIAKKSLLDLHYLIS